MSESNCPLLIYVSSLPCDAEARFDVDKQVAQLGALTTGLVWDSKYSEYDWALVRRQIQQADAFILLVGHEYGPMTPTGISFQHRELVYAQSLNKPVYGFIHDRVGDYSTPELKLAELRQQVTGQIPHKIWHLGDELTVHAKTTVSNWLRQPRLGSNTSTPLTAVTAPALSVTASVKQLAAPVSTSRRQSLPVREDIEIVAQANVYRGGNLARHVVRLPMKTDRLWRSLMPLLRLGTSEDRLRAHIEQVITAEVSTVLLAEHRGSHAVDGVRIERNQFRQLLKGWADSGHVSSTKEGARTRWALLL